MVDSHQSAAETGGSPGGHALRLTFSYEGNSVALVSSQPVDMILPPSHSLEPAQNETGFWYTLTDAGGRVVYRRVIHNPIRLDREVFSPDKQQSLHRQTVQNPKGTFVLLVPDVSQARTLRLFSHPVGLKENASAPAREFARFNLAEQERKQ